MAEEPIDFQSKNEQASPFDASASHASEEKYRTIFESIHEGFCIYEIVYDDSGKPVDLRWIEVNPAYETQTGLTDVVGKLHSELGLATEQYWYDIYDQVARTGEAVHFENWHEPTARWYHVFTSRIGGAASRQVAVLFEDITERKAREKRQAFLLRFSDLLRAQPDEHSIKEQIVRMLGEHLRADRCYISEVFEQQGYSTVGPEHIRRADLPPMTGVYQLSDYPETMRQLATQPMVVHDAANDPRFSESEKALLAGLPQQALLVAPLRKGPREVIWALVAAMATPRNWTEAERVLLEEVAERTWAAIERAHAEEALRENQDRLRLLNETLQQQVQQKTREVRQLATEVIRSTQRERQRLSQILHDDLQQRVYAIQLQMGFVEDGLQSEQIRKEMSDIRKQLHDILQITRHLSIDLNPPILREEGLTQAIDWLGTRVKEQYSLAIDVQADGAFAISDEELHVLLFNSVRELLFNVVKHAGANQAVVVLQWVDSGLRIEVRDNGKGFSPQTHEEVNDGRSLRGLGLAKIRHELSLFGGSLEFRSTPGEGTRAILFVPAAVAGS